MRRYQSPFAGKRYILNRNTHEVHDLDCETASCKIDEIKSAHIYSCDTYIEAASASIMLDKSVCNGCAFCMPQKNTG